MTLDVNVFFFEKPADGKVLVDDGYMYRVRVDFFEFSNELVRLIEARLSEVSIEKGTQGRGDTYGESKGGGRAVVIAHLNKCWRG